jgi:hypothetical protein
MRSHRARLRADRKGLRSTFAIAVRLRRYVNFAAPARFVKPARSEPSANVTVGVARRRTSRPGRGSRACP